MIFMIIPLALYFIIRDFKQDERKENNPNG